VSGRPRTTSRRARVGAVALGAVLVGLCAGLAALAYWTAAGTASAGASVGTLEPASISALGGSPGEVTLTWDAQAAVVPGSLSSAVTYTVERRLGAGVFEPVPAGGCAGTLPHATASCDDSVDVGGSYTYRVVAHLSTAWTAVSNEVTVNVVLDSEPPTTTIGFPSDGATLNAFAYAAGCLPTGACGTAADPSGVDTVRVSVRRESDGGYWTGSGFGGFSEYFVDATLLTPGASTTSWSLPLPLPADGRYAIRVQAKDTAGNDSSPSFTSSATFDVDTLGPTTFLATDPATPDGADGWFRRSSVDVVLSATDPAPGSGVAGTTYRVDGGPAQTYTGPATLATQGDHEVTYQSVDGAGNAGPLGSSHVKLDDVAPTTAIVLVPASPDGANGWYRSPTTFTLSASDATSGVSATSYRIDGGPVVVYAGGAVAVPEGQHAVSYWSADAAGNTEAAKTTATIKVDTTAPSTTFATVPAAPDGANGWFRQSTVSFTLTGADATSGVTTRHYTLDGGAPQTYTGAVAVTTPGDHVVTYWSTDTAGNAGSASTAHVKLDAVAPVTTLTTSPATPDGANGWFRQPAVSFTLAAVDATSGVASTVYAVDGGAPQPYAGAVSISTPGPHTVTYWSTDTAGNTEAVKTATVKLDDVAPVTTLATTPASPNGANGWFTSSVSFTLSATDATSGVAARHYRLDGGATQTYSAAVPVAQGTHSVEYWSVDTAGNAGTHVTVQLRSDTTVPVTTLATTPGSPDGTNGWFRQSSVTFTLSATDATSGVAARFYTVDGGAAQTYGGTVTVSGQGAHAVTYWSTDNAGNVESVKTAQIKLDNVAPTVPRSSSGATRRAGRGPCGCARPSPMRRHSPPPRRIPRSAGRAGRMPPTRP
jgi:hypothetical protein